MFRNTYKVTQEIQDGLYRCYYHPWYWPFYRYFTCSFQQAIAEKHCHDHAKPATKYLGKLPKKDKTNAN